ncbi:MAG: hypothetical protein ACC652_11615 [Acidimicrobiales bacterium]
MTDETDVDDPGWPGFALVLLSMYPGGMRQMQHRSFMNAEAPLVVLRKVHMRLMSTQALIAIIAVLLVVFVDLQGSASKVLVIAGIVTVGVALALIPRATDRPLDCAEPLLAQYQTRFFKRVAYASVPQIAGFIGLIFTGDLYPYVLGAAFSVVGHLYAAPSHSNIEHDAKTLSDSGCDRSLVMELHGYLRDGEEPT